MRNQQKPNRKAKALKKIAIPSVFDDHREPPENYFAIWQADWDKLVADLEANDAK